MKRIQLLTALLIGLTLPGCNRDTDYDANDSRDPARHTNQHTHDTNDPEHPESSEPVTRNNSRYPVAIRESYNPVHLNRVGIDEQPSTMDKVRAQNDTTPAVNPRIHRVQDTTPVGDQTGTRDLETNRYYNPITRTGSLAGQKPQDQVADGDSNTVSNQIDLTRADSQLKTFDALIAKAGLEQMISSGDYTLLAPTDTAFAHLPKAQLAALQQDRDRLRQFLLNHMLQKPLTSRDFNQIKSAPTMHARDSVSFSRDAKTGRLHVRDAHIIRNDLRLGTSYVHVIDKVLIPSGFKF